MATANLVLNATGITITSKNEAGSIINASFNQTTGEIVYTCERSYVEQWGSVIASLPQNLRSNITITNIEVSASRGSPTRPAIKAGYSYSNVIKDLNSGKITSFPIYFYYKPTTEIASLPYYSYQRWISASVSAHQLSWSNITCTITYEYNTQYSLDKTSVANGEDLTLTLSLTPNTNIEAEALSAQILDANNNVIMTFSPLNSTALTKGTLYTFTKTITYNSGDVGGVKYLKILNGANQLGEIITINSLVCVSERQEPEVNNIETGEPKIKFTNSLYWSGLDKPTFTCGQIITDPNVPDATITSAYITFSHTAVSSITLNTMLIDVNGNTSWDLEPFILAEDYPDDSLITGYTLHLIDAYNNSITINSSADIEINKYNAPFIDDTFMIQRYMLNSVTQEPEIAAEGTLLLINGKVGYDNRLNTTLTFRYTDENNATHTTDAVTISGNGIFINDTTIFGNMAFRNDLDYTIYATLQDAYTSITKEFEIVQAIGYLNVEQYGVAIGGIAHGTADNHMFECYYPMYLVFNDVRYRVKTATISGQTCLVLGDPEPLNPSAALPFTLTSTAWYDGDDYTVGGTRYKCNRFKYSLNGTIQAGRTYNIAVQVKFHNAVGADYGGNTIMYSGGYAFNTSDYYAPSEPTEHASNYTWNFTINNFLITDNYSTATKWRDNFRILIASKVPGTGTNSWGGNSAYWTNEPYVKLSFTPTI